MIPFIQAIMLVLTALGAGAVVVTRQPESQTIVLSVFGMILAVLMLMYQAPDVALCEIVAGSVAMPMVLLLAMAQIRKTQARKSPKQHERDS